MDSVDPELVDQVGEVLRRVPGIEAVENVSIRWVGHELRAEVEVISDSDLTIVEGHQIAEEDTTDSSMESRSWPGRPSTPAPARTMDGTTMPRRAITSARPDAAVFTAQMLRGRRRPPSGDASSPSIAC